MLTLDQWKDLWMKHGISAYQILGLEPTASLADIKQARKGLALFYDSDRGPGQVSVDSETINLIDERVQPTMKRLFALDAQQPFRERSQAVQDAFELLRSKDRQIYDDFIKPRTTYTRTQNQNFFREDFRNNFVGRRGMTPTREERQEGSSHHKENRGHRYLYQDEELSPRAVYSLLSSGHRISIAQRSDDVPLCVLHIIKLEEDVGFNILETLTIGDNNNVIRNLRYIRFNNDPRHPMIDRNIGVWELQALLSEIRPSSIQIESFGTLKESVEEQLIKFKNIVEGGRFSYKEKAKHRSSPSSLYSDLPDFEGMSAKDGNKVTEFEFAAILLRECGVRGEQMKRMQPFIPLHPRSGLKKGEYDSTLTSLLMLDLEWYAHQRKWGPKHKRKVLGINLGFTRDEKLEAVEQLLKKLRGEKVELSSTDVAALSQGDLKKVFKAYGLFGKGLQSFLAADNAPRESKRL